MAWYAISGGRDEYENATNMIFDQIVSMGDYSSLPNYDPEKDKKKTKARKR